jgi:hypothetical protein
MRTAIVCTTILLMLAAPSMAQAGVYLDNVEGLTNGSIQVGPGSVRFNLGISNSGIGQIVGLSNGFQIYGSDSSVTWEVRDYGPVPDIIFLLDQYYTFAPPQFHGVGADTIGFSGGSMTAGIPDGYNGPFFWITVVLADSASIGGTFCLDSAWFPSSGIWMWGYSGGPSVMPSWDGPHCWPIVGSCCVDQRGNIDGSAGDQIDISDLVYLVDYMFNGGPAPPCMEEADIDGSGEINIADLVALVDYMFNFGFPPADCP